MSNCRRWQDLGAGKRIEPSEAGSLSGCDCSSTALLLNTLLNNGDGLFVRLVLLF